MCDLVKRISYGNVAGRVDTFWFPITYYKRRNLRNNGKGRILVANYSIHSDLYHFLLSHGQYDLLYTIRSAIQNREVIEKFRVLQRMDL